MNVGMMNNDVVCPYACSGCCATAKYSKDKGFSKDEIYNILKDMLNKTGNSFKDPEGNSTFIDTITFTGGECLLTEDGKVIANVDEVEKAPLLAALKQVADYSKTNKMSFSSTPIQIHTSAYWAADPKIAEKMGEVFNSLKESLMDSEGFLLLITSIDAYHETGVKPAIVALKNRGNKAAEELYNNYINIKDRNVEGAYIEMMKNIMNPDFNFSAIRMIDSKETKKRNDEIKCELEKYSQETYGRPVGFDRSDLEPAGRGENSKDQCTTKEFSNLDLNCPDFRPIITPKSIVPCCSPFGYDIKVNLTKEEIAELRDDAKNDKFDFSKVLRIYKNSNLLGYTIQTEGLDKAYDFVEAKMPSIADKLKSEEFTSNCHLCSQMQKYVKSYLNENKVSANDLTNKMVEYTQEKKLSKVLDTHFSKAKC